jgi:hypothetical protein
VTALEKQLYTALKEAHAHLEYCNYGDEWERSCAEGLDKQIRAALDAARNLSTFP